MHELGLLTSVVEKIEEVVPRRRVTKVSMRVGDRSGVVYDSLIAAWPVAAEGTNCQGAEFDAELIVSTVYCPTCAAEHEIDEFYALTCPVCGTPTADLRHGREFEISSVEVETDEPSAASETSVPSSADNPGSSNNPGNPGQHGYLGAASGPQG